MNFFIDFTKFNEPELQETTSYTRIYTSTKIDSSLPKYIFKKFRFDCSSPEKQKIILNTFQRIKNQNSQYIQSYTQLSFSYKMKFNPTFSMPFISLTTLQQVLNDGKFRHEWSIQDIMGCLFAVAEGMKYLHSNLIYHGNLCPSNIIVDAAKQCYLCDFGLYPIKKVYYNDLYMFDEDYRDPFMQNDVPLLANDIYSFGVLICDIYRCYYQQTEQESLQFFIEQRRFNNLGPFFSDLILSCLNSSIEKRPTFKQISTYLKGTKASIGNVSIKELYDNFISRDYIVSLANNNDPYALNTLGKRYEKTDYKKALHYYEKAAHLNDSDGQNNFGILLLNDPNKRKNKLIEGANYLKLSAEQGNIHGLNNYGLALKSGTGVSVDFEKAEECFKKAAYFGLSNAQVNYALSLFENNPTNERKNKGLALIRSAIDKGDPDAYYNFGLLLKAGKFVDKDEKLAMEYFKVAAELGNKSAIVEYADANFNGIGIQKDYKTALEFYKKAYQMGNKDVIKKIIILTNETQDNISTNKDSINSPPVKQFDMENELQSAEIIPSNEPKSNDLNSIHLDKLNFDEKTPQNELFSIYKNLKSKNLLFKYEEKLAKTNNSLIIYKLGKFFYKNGSSAFYNEKAKKYLKQSADLGYAKAQSLYGIMLQNGDGIEKNQELGLAYLEKAANQGDLIGICNYGIALYNDRNDKELGLKYLKRAADQELPLAQLNFGLCTEDKKLGHIYIENAYKANYTKAFIPYAKDLMNGIGVEKNVQKAADVLINLYDMKKKTKVLFLIIKCLKQIDYKQALKYIKVLADLEDDNKYICQIHKARYQYGLELIKGKYVEQNNEEGIKYLLKSNQMILIKEKHPEIYSLLPPDLSRVKDKIQKFLSRSGQVDPKEEEVIKSAFKGNANDIFQAARMIEKFGDFETANFLLEASADSNQMEAAFILGKHYLCGENGLTIDIEKGMKYLHKSKILGNREAENFLQRIQQMDPEKVKTNEKQKDNERTLNSFNNHPNISNSKADNSESSLNTINIQALKNEPQKVSVQSNNRQGSSDTVYHNQHPINVQLPSNIKQTLLNSNDKQSLSNFIHTSDKESTTIKQPPINVQLSSKNTNAVYTKTFPAVSNSAKKQSLPIPINVQIPSGNEKSAQNNSSQNNKHSFAHYLEDPKEKPNANDEHLSFKVIKVENTKQTTKTNKPAPINAQMPSNYEKLAQKIQPTNNLETINAKQDLDKQNKKDEFLSKNITADNDKQNSFSSNIINKQSLHQTDAQSSLNNKQSKELNDKSLNDNQSSKYINSDNMKQDNSNLNSNSNKSLSSKPAPIDAQLSSNNEKSVPNKKPLPNRSNTIEKQISFKNVKIENINQVSTNSSSVFKQQNLSDVQLQPNNKQSISSKLPINEGNATANKSNQINKQSSSHYMEKSNEKSLSSIANKPDMQISLKNVKIENINHASTNSSSIFKQTIPSDVQLPSSNKQSVSSKLPLNEVKMTTNKSNQISKQSSSHYMEKSNEKSLPNKSNTTDMRISLKNVKIENINHASTNSSSIFKQTLPSDVQLQPNNKQSVSSKLPSNEGKAITNKSSQISKQSSSHYLETSNEKSLSSKANTTDKQSSSEIINLDKNKQIPISLYKPTNVVNMQNLLPNPSFIDATKEKAEPSASSSSSNNSQSCSQSTLSYNMNHSPEDLVKIGDELLENGEVDEAFDYYTEAAKRGYSYAYMKCAKHTTSFEQKLEYYNLAKQNNVPNSFSEWRKCILKHLSLMKDESNYLHSAKEFAKLFEENEDFSDACNLYQKAEDYVNFQYCYEKAKENLHSIQDGYQQYNFAAIIEKQNDINLAILMYRKAFENGISQAEKKIQKLQKILSEPKNRTDLLIEEGICYYEGKNGTPVDIEKASELLTEASDIGSSKADFYLGKIYKELKQDLISFYYYNKSAEAHDPDGLDAIGDYFLHGIGTEKNPLEAVTFYKEAADKDNPNSSYKYGKYLYEKSQTKKEKNLAISYILKSAGKLHPDALRFYAKLIEKTDPEDSKKFIKYLDDKTKKQTVTSPNKKEMAPVVNKEILPVVENEKNVLVSSPKSKFNMSFSAEISLGKPGLLSQLKTRQKTPFDRLFISSQSSNDVYNLLINKPNDFFYTGNDPNFYIQFELQSSVTISGMKLYTCHAGFPKSFCITIDGKLVKYIMEAKELNWKNKEMTINFTPVRGKKVRFTQKGPNWDLGNNKLYIKGIELLSPEAKYLRGVFATLVDESINKDPHKCPVIISAPWFDLNHFYLLNASDTIFTFALPNSWFQVELTQGTAVLTGFRLKRRNSSKMKSYKLICLDDSNKQEISWITLMEIDEKSENEHEELGIYIFPHPSPPTRIVRLIQTGPDWSGKLSLTFYHFDLFGTYY